ncbi:NlpC/P60 family protein [Prauserella shujinwangii]|uniref:NlpC/P60 family protein n=1 Tax=Prauserella shujinwangii TaxID=1453103 RepID=A0A2T0LZD6_9PSEU|nr:C40 family peptidase [Prauserella shujinwangii]PRX49477.1 NlpC/P60 family protein [Prauserella shujinwangii]
MTVGDEPPAAEAGDHVRPRRRALIVALVAALLAAGGLVVTLRLAPADQRVNPAAATGGSAPGTTTAAPAPASETTTAPAVPRETPVPEEKGPRFQAWVDDVAGWLDIPRRAMHAYAAATVRLGEEQPGCNLSWVTLAGVGKTTTNHGRHGGGKVTADGTVSRPIGTVELRDFAGRVISQPGAAGPMQLAPAVWQRWRVSASGAAPDIQDLDDAALTAGRALCAGGRDIGRGEDWLAAVSALHDAPLFLHRVLAYANVYGTVGKEGEPPNRAALQAVSFAISKIGLPYEWGGNGRERGDVGFDCSGLTTAAYASAGVELLRTAHWQYNSVPLVPAGEQPRLGDLIFYGDPATKIHHVGIYIGNQQMVDAPTFGQAVQVHNYRSPGDNYAGAGRPAG